MSSILKTTDIWQDVIASVRSQLNRQIIDTWFRPIEIEELREDGTVVLRGGYMTIDWLRSYYSDLIIRTLSDLGHPVNAIEWSIDESRSAESRFAPRPDDDEFEFSSQHTSLEPARAAAEPAAPAPVVDTFEHSLNPKYTFEKFVVGNSNRFAHAAALAAADAPGMAYNPLFIYGGVGLGKTHLMHALGHAIRGRDAHMRVAYVTSEKFMNELIKAIRYDTTESFRARYRSIDVLLMDDIQFLAGKERTQEEFFHTFNTLYDGQKQLVISSDCPPREIPTLEERLHSRFEWGLIADIEPPDLETKVAILKRKADLDGVDLPDEIAIFIANKIRSNVRELEGSLVRLVAIASLRGVPISKMLAQDALKNVIDSERPEGLTMERIARRVASHYKLSLEELKSKNNSRAIALPRQVAMYLCKRLTNHSYPEIGREFGGKHHTTVMHSFDKIEALVTENREFHKLVSELIDSLCS